MNINLTPPAPLHDGEGEKRVADFVLAEHLAHDADCGAVEELEIGGMIFHVCRQCGQMWDEQPISVRIVGETKLIWDDEFLKAFKVWNQSGWYALGRGDLMGESYQEIIGGRLVWVCYGSGFVWEVKA